ncbi:MAG: hypothetical protein HQ596_06530 [Candidatus Saganbacteria bacterium]|nr:hypothetical protein [Candidatus Saganbacteria bacterium]
MEGSVSQIQLQAPSVQRSGSSADQPAAATALASLGEGRGNALIPEDYSGIIPAAEVRTARLIPVRRAKNKEGHTTLRWNFAPCQAGPNIRYNVYRSFFSGRHHEQINNTPLAVKEFEDESLTFGGYRYYIIQAIDGSGNTVGLSKEIKAKCSQPNRFTNNPVSASTSQYPEENSNVNGEKLRQVFSPYWSSFSESDRQLAEKLISFFDVMNEPIHEMYRSLFAYPLNCEPMALLVGMLLKETLGLDASLATTYYGSSFFDNQNYLIFSIGGEKFVLDWAADCFEDGASPAVLPYETVLQDSRYYMYRPPVDIKEISHDKLEEHGIAEIYPELLEHYLQYLGPQKATRETCTSYRDAYARGQLSDAFYYDNFADYIPESLLPHLNGYITFCKRFRQHFYEGGRCENGDGYHYVVEEELRGFSAITKYFTPQAIAYLDLFEEPHIDDIAVSFAIAQNPELQGVMGDRQNLAQIIKQKVVAPHERDLDQESFTTNLAQFPLVDQVKIYIFQAALINDVELRNQIWDLVDLDRGDEYSDREVGGGLFFDPDTRKFAFNPVEGKPGKDGTYLPLDFELVREYATFASFHLHALKEYDLHALKKYAGPSLQDIHKSTVLHLEAGVVITPVGEQQFNVHYYRSKGNTPPQGWSFNLGSFYAE